MRRRMASVDYTQRANESITLPDDGFEETRRGGIVTKRKAYFSHEGVDVLLGIDKEVGPPEFCDNVLAGNQLIAAADQENQQVHGLLGELHRPPRAADFVATQIKLDFFERWFCTRHEISIGHYPSGFSDLRRHRKDMQISFAVYGEHAVFQRGCSCGRDQSMEAGR